MVEIEDLMLAKTICQKCVKKAGLAWDEGSWTSGFVFCPHTDISVAVEIGDNYPDHCAYRLEHLISKNDKIHNLEN